MPQLAEAKREGKVGIRNIKRLQCALCVLRVEWGILQVCKCEYTILYSPVCHNECIAFV